MTDVGIIWKDLKSAIVYKNTLTSKGKILERDGKRESLNKEIKKI